MKHLFTKLEAMHIGHKLGINFTQVNIEQFRQGLTIELEHGSHDASTNVSNNDIYITGKIAWAHLKEIPDYYTKLAKMETESKKAKRS